MSSIYFVLPVLRDGAETPDFFAQQGVDPVNGLGFETAYDAVLWAQVVQTHPDVIGTTITPDLTTTP